MNNASAGSARPPVPLHHILGSYAEEAGRAAAGAWFRPYLLWELDTMPFDGSRGALLATIEAAWRAGYFAGESASEDSDDESYRALEHEAAELREQLAQLQAKP